MKKNKKYIETNFIHASENTDVYRNISFPRLLYHIFTHVTLLDTSMRDPLFSFPVSVCFALPISNLYCVLGIFNFDSPVIPLLLIAFVIGGPLIFHPSPNSEATSIKWKRFLVWGEQGKERTTTIITTQLHEN